MQDGSAGDADYGRIGRVYAGFRTPDARIAGVIERALGDARTVLNVGAGTGSYEPRDREVTAVEPSASMRAKRTARKPAVDATAESLPFEDNSFDAAMGTFTVHQWQDLEQGLREVRRVTRGPVVFLTCDPRLVRRFWLDEYCPEVLSTEARRYPELARIGGRVVRVPVPLDCTDGFNEAYYGRPEMLLDPDARQACSAWSFVEKPARERFERQLRADLEDGTWDRNHGHLRTQPTLDGSLVLMVSES